MSAPLVSICIVNWNSGAMTRGLVANLRRQRLPGHDAGQGLEFVVVDNASGEADAEHLAALDGEPDVTVVRSAQNSGYATGMNQAVARATGRFVVMTNPDVMVFRGALAAMIEHLDSDDSIGMVGPRGYLDPHRFFQLPPTELPSLCDLTSEAFARSIKTCGERHARGRTRRAIEQWTAIEGTPVSQLSGFCTMMLRELALELGPFDAEYPFYFEDADLCLRLHRRGFTTDFVPRAEMTHFFNRSAGQAQEAAMSRYDVSKRRFFRRRYGLPGQLLAGVLMGAMGHGKGHQFAQVDELGECRQTPVLEVPGTGAYVAELAADPGFVFAAGRLDVSRRFQIPQVVWDGLVDATYFVRFLDRRTLSVLRTVSMVKTGGSQAIDAESAAAELVHA